MSDNGVFVGGEPSLLIVEDDPDLCAVLVEGLSLQSFRVEAVGSALELYRVLGLRNVDAVIVDLGLPDLDGIEIARFLRQQTHIGIIAITADPSLDTRLRFFESGADLFFAKPVDVRELAMASRGLILRLRAAAASRRRPDAPESAAEGGRAAPPAAPDGEEPDWTINAGSWTIRSPDGRTAHLSAKEMQFAAALCRSPGAAVTREALRGILGYPDTADGDRSLEALVRRVRTKLKAIGGDPTPVQTVHGSGYLFSATVRLR